MAPQVFGQALRINPLLVIFALLLGAQLYGIIGALLALPIAAIARETVVYLRRHLVLEPWGRRAWRVPPAGLATPLVEPCAPECRRDASPSDRRRAAPPAAASRPQAPRDVPEARRPLRPRRRRASKRFGDARCATHVRRRARRVIGPNGAGKTTLLSILAGIQPPSEGSVSAPAASVGWVPQQPAVYSKLSVAENLRLFARLERVADPEAAVAGMLEQTGLERPRRRRGRQRSRAATASA